MKRSFHGSLSASSAAIRRVLVRPREERAQFHKFAAAIGLVVFLAVILQSRPWMPVFATSTYYVDYSVGCDTNDGLHETQVSGSCPTGGSGPFAHAPGMKGLTPAGASTGDGCVSNCAAVSPGAGTVIVLKGGVVWPNTVFPWVVPGNGTSAGGQTYGCGGAGCLYVGNAIGAGLAAWNKGIVNSVTLTRDLCGWSGTLTVSLTGGGGTGAAATASLVPPYSATVPTPSGFQNDPNIAGCIYHVAVTNQGSGYTSAPSCAISGTNSNGAGVWALCVADIDRPVMDLGGTQGSPVDWTFVGGAAGVPYCPQTGNYSIIYGIECRNMMFTTYTGGVEVNGIINGGSHSTVTRNYVHGAFVDCAYPFGGALAGPSCANPMNTLPGAISPFYPYSEVSFNTIENGDSFYVATATSVANGIGHAVGDADELGPWGIMTGTQGAHGPVSVHNNWEYGGQWQVRLAGNNVGGDTTNPFLDYANETWLTMYSVNPGSHINRHYSQMIAPNTGSGGAAILVSYNNIDHNHVRGSGNQQQCQSGQTFYFFNWVAWAWGTSSPAFGINTVSPAVGGCTVYALNSTLTDTFNDTSGLCINSNSSATNPTPIIVQNLHCLGTTTPNPFWSGSGTNITYENYAGSSVTANVQASSVADSIANALTQGYGLGSLFAAPGETVTFATSSGTANLTALCSTQTYLAPLCFDIKGNQRPAVGGWNAGAYQYGGLVLPPLNLSLTAH